MSRIDEALRRIARRETIDSASSGPAWGTGPQALDRFQFEGAPTDSLPVAPVQLPAPPPRREPPAKTASGPHSTSEDGPSDSEKLIDLEQLADYVGFAIRSVGRRKWLAGATFLLTLGLAGGALAIWPKTYHIEARLLAQRNDVMAALNNPRRTIPRDADSPTRAAGETVLRRDNLVALIKQTDLLNQWQATRPPALRFKDRVFRMLRAEPTEAEKLDAMVGLLEQRFQISTDLEGVVIVSLNWPDARAGYELVQTAIQNFLETRQVAETSAIADSVSILERHEATLQNDVNATFEDVQAEQSKRRPSPSVQAAPPKTTASAASPVMPRLQSMTDYALTSPTPETASRVPRLRAAVEAKRAEVSRLEDFRGQQLSDLQGKLATALTIYTEDHPTVTSLRQAIASISRDSPQLTGLKSEAQSLESEYQAAVEQEAAAERDRAQAAQANAAPASAASATPEPSTQKPSTTIILRESAGSKIALDPAPLGLGPEYSNPTNVRLRMQLSQLGEIRERLESARIELATSQASFKYRYGMVRPPQIPKKPLKPNTLLVMLAGILGAFALAFAAPVGADIMTGRVIEAWQVERQLGTPVLARVRSL